MMADVTDRSRKRRKLDPTTASDAVQPQSLEQLRRLFQFSKNSPAPEIKRAVHHFRDFLIGIQKDAEAGHGSTTSLKTLKGYCEEQSAASHEHVDFPDILTTWANAAESNDEAVLGAIAAALAQFFKTISGRLDFRDFGLSLCHSLLKRDQLRIFDRALSAPKLKDFLIASNLRLLTEVITFDEGALAGKVFGRRDYLYRRLDGIVGTTQSAQGEILAAHKAALEFLVGNLKYLDTSAKTELITHGRTIYAAVRSLAQETSEAIIETLNALDQWILDDDTLSKQLKGRCFNSGVLTALAKLYDFEQAQNEEGNDSEKPESVRSVVHKLLLKICTTNKAILLSQAGFYPAGMNPETHERNENIIDLGLDSPFYFDDYNEKIPVKNGGLSTFIQALKPGEDILQAELATATFAAAPELVADYFSKKPKLLGPPGDNPLWRGQFAFLFSVVQLDVPSNLGWSDALPPTPPPLSIVIESVIPRPLDRAITTKCLQSEDEILKLSAIRLLIVALNKLRHVLQIINQGGTKSQLWSQAWVKFTDLFIERVPPLQEVIATLQSLSSENEQLRATVLECIASYHQVLPSAAAALKFDTSPLLSSVLQRLDSKDLSQSARETLNEQALSLLTIAGLSPVTKWWHKSTTESLSPVTLLLKFCVEYPANALTNQATPTLRDLLTSKGVLSYQSRAIEALISSLSSTKKWEAELSTYQFLDNCMTRTMQRPVKYLDQVEQLQQLESDKKDLSLIACCVAEQWPFVLKKEEKAATKNITGWIARFFSALDAAGENYLVLLGLQRDMLKGSQGYEKGKDALEKAFDRQRKKPTALADPASTVMNGTSSGADILTYEATLPASSGIVVDLDKVFPTLPSGPKSLTGLTRWDKADFESDIQSGRLANLIRCLVSPDQEIRLQAFHTLQTVLHTVEQSTYSEKTQLYLLLGELNETVKTHMLKSGDAGTSEPLPAPTIVSELAVALLSVISDPSSPFYQKTNTFLLRGPAWSPGQLIPHWATATFLTEPESDDAFGPGASTNSGTGTKNAQHGEISHFLASILIPSLRTPADLDLFRRAQLFTRLFSYYTAAACPRAIRKQILHIVHLAAGVPGGSDMLITRTGVREWLSVVRDMREHSGAGPGRFGKVDVEIQGIVDALAVEIAETCDASAIASWERMRPVLKRGDETSSAKAKDHDEQEMELD